MLCKSCGAIFSEGDGYCSKCRTSAEAVSSSTRLPFNPAVTKIFQGKNLSKTVVYTPPRKPIFGWLVVIDGPDAWLDFKIAEEDAQIFLGSGEECQLKLQDEQMAKMHASIRKMSDKITIADLDTLSGTLVNDKPITKTDLQDGDTVTVGKTTLKFRRL